MAEDRTFTCAECRRTWPYDAVDKVPSLEHRACICGECASPKVFTHFGGSTYDPARDGKRLSAQQLAVNAVMSDGQWHKSVEVAKAIGAKPESYAAVTSRIRDIRKICKSEEAVERRHLGGGLWEFRVPERFRAHIEVAA